jgi:ribonuclease HI
MTDGKSEAKPETKQESKSETKSETKSEPKTEAKAPETLTDLLRTLERSRDLRPLARECGLTVRELRRRLSTWRRDLGDEAAAALTAAAVLAAAGATEDAARPLPPAPIPLPPPPARASKFPELPAAADLAESPLPASGSPVLEVFTDGASRGNPGPASIGVVFRQKDGPTLCTHGEAIGSVTNNVAEYRAVLTALQICRRWNVARVHLLVDSELVARQLTGVYRVKSPDLLPLFQQVQHLARQLREFQVRHIPRERNAHADHVANLALDAAKPA